MATFAFIGFGELASALAERIAGAGPHAIRAYAPRRDDPAAREALESRLRRARATRADSAPDAAAQADAVLSVVPSSASLEVARELAPALSHGALFVDLTAAPVADIRTAAELVAQAGARYVDAAVLGAVAAVGADAPSVVSGPGAADWCALASECGLPVELLDGPAGQATLLKLLRSVYMKGREALILEMMVAARRHGLEEQVARSIAGPGEQVPFSALADRVLCSLALHARRRAGELLSSSEVLADAGVEPLATRAGAQVLEELARLGLGQAFAHERPASGADVLARLEELSAGGAAGDRG